MQYNVSVPAKIRKKVLAERDTVVKDIIADPERVESYIDSINNLSELKIFLKKLCKIILYKL